MSIIVHKTLVRQSRKYLGELAEDPRLADFLKAVEDSYIHADRDRLLLERSMEISSNELIAKNEMLARKNEALDTFVYRVSHDLKGPVNNMLAMTKMIRELVLEANASPMAEKVVKNLESACNNLNFRIKDLLEMTRIDRNIDEKIDLVSFPEIVGQIVKNLDATIQSTQAVVEFDFKGYPSIGIGRENLNSILGNLIENAIKYRDPSRPPHVRLRTEPKGGKCLLQVTDNGLGMDLQKSGTKLFSLFTRLHSHVEGSGIGLYLVKKIVESKGGSVTVESKPGEGTSFQLLLHDELATA